MTTFHIGTNGTSMHKLTFRSRTDNLDIYATTAARAEQALRNYLADSHGALETNVRAGADIYAISHVETGKTESVERVSVLDYGGEQYEDVYDVIPLARYV